MSLKIYSADQIKAWDQFTIHHEAIASLELMERAATACTNHILENHDFNTCAIFCGIGNNGGDGLAIARQLFEQGKVVKVYVLQFSRNYTPDCFRNLKILPMGMPLEMITPESDWNTEINADLIIDAIFGTGLNRPIENDWSAVIVNQINRSTGFVLSIDIPSGLFCDDNSMNPLINVVKADKTLTFQRPKKVFFFSKYAKYIGHFTVLNIGLSLAFKSESNLNFLLLRDVKLKPRELFSHKGKNGYLMVVGGLENMPGAIVLTAKSAQRTGCGYIYAKMANEHIFDLIKDSTESVYLKENELTIPEKVKAIAIGPGLGQSDLAVDLLDMALNAKLRLVLDADALNIIAEKKWLNRIPRHSILTPHVKELERLIGEASTEETFLDRQLSTSMKYDIFIIQKGAFSKLTTPDGEIYINSTGNPGMAVAGTGDVLTGVIGALLAQGYHPLDAAQYGMLIHGEAGDLVQADLGGDLGHRASDIIEKLPIVCNQQIKA